MIKWPDKLATGFALLGNTMSVNVLQRLLISILRVPGHQGLHDPWENGQAIAALQEDCGKDAAILRPGKRITDFFKKKGDLLGNNKGCTEPQANAHPGGSALGSKGDAAKDAPKQDGQDKEVGSAPQNSTRRLVPPADYIEEDATPQYSRLEADQDLFSSTQPTLVGRQGTKRHGYSYLDDLPSCIQLLHLSAGDPFMDIDVLNGGDYGPDDPAIFGTDSESESGNRSMKRQKVVYRKSLATRPIGNDDLRPLCRMGKGEKGDRNGVPRHGSGNRSSHPSPNSDMGARSFASLNNTEQGYSRDTCFAESVSLAFPSLMTLLGLL